MPEKRHNLYYIIIFVAFVSVGVVVHARYINNPFMHDDEASVSSNPALISMSNVPAYFRDPTLFAVSRKQDMYRPLLLTTYAINYKLSGFDPWSWRLFNIIIIAANAVLLAALLNAFGVRRYSSFAAGLIYAAHPIAGYCFRLVSARSSLLMTLFILIGLLLHLRAIRSESKGWIYITISLFSMIAGLLCVSAAIVFPVLALLIEGAKIKNNIKGVIARVTPGALIAVSYVLFRHYLMGRAFGGNYVRPININLAMQVEAIWMYVKWVFYPINMPVYVMLKAPENIFDSRVVVSATGLLIWAAVGLKLWLGKKEKAIGMFMLWQLGAYIPYAAIPLNVPVAYHHFYLSLVGAIGLAAIMIDKIKSKTAVALVVLICICFMALNNRADSPWSDKLVWAGNNVRETPSVGRAWNDLGAIYADRGENALAVAAYRIALEEDPKILGVLNNIAISYFDMGEYETSLKYLLNYQERVKGKPLDPQLMGLIGMNLERLGKAGEALPYLDAGLSGGYGDSPELLRHKALALASFGRKNEAIAVYDKLLKAAPNYLDALLDRAKMALDDEDVATATRFIEKTRSAYGLNPDVAALEARALMKTGRFDEALSRLNAARTRFPQKAELWFLSGDALAALGRKDRALLSYSRALELPLKPAEREYVYRRIKELNAR